MNYHKNQSHEVIIMKNGKLGYAVVGLGIGRAHMDAAAESERADLIAVCDLIEKKLETAKKKYPYVKTYTDFDTMLEDDEIDVISICLPSAMHAEYACRTMAKGKHVLIEKPIDITPEAAEKIEEARLKYGVTAGVVHQNRYNAPMDPIKKAVDEGRLGKLAVATFGVKWFRDQSYYNGNWHGTWDMDGGGSLMNQAVHTVDLMQWLMGDVVSVHSVMGIYNHDIETEDMTASVITFKSGAAATFVSTTCAYPGISTEISLYGSKGSIEADADILKTWKLADADDEEEEEEKMLELYGKGNGKAQKNDPSLLFGHKAVVEDIISAVLDGHEPLIMPREAIKSVRIVNAVYESAKTGKTVYLEKGE